MTDYTTLANKIIGFVQSAQAGKCKLESKPIADMIANEHQNITGFVTAIARMAKDSECIERYGVAFMETEPHVTLSRLIDEARALVGG